MGTLAGALRRPVSSGRRRSIRSRDSPGRSDIRFLNQTKFSDWPDAVGLSVRLQCFRLLFPLMVLLVTVASFFVGAMTRVFRGGEPRMALPRFSDHVPCRRSR